MSEVKGMFKIMEENIKAEKFIELAEFRINKVIKAIELIGNLANKNNYQYTEEQANQIFEAIEIAFDNAKSRFKTDKTKDLFKFIVSRCVTGTLKRLRICLDQGGKVNG